MKLSAEKYIPYAGKVVKCYTKYGERRAVFCPKELPLFWGFYALDCTHPLQNCNLNGCVELWEYENKEDEQNLLFRDNPFYHYDEGNKIINTIKFKKWWQFWK